MSFRNISSDESSERLLLVVLEEPTYGNSEYRHIRATVVRRAVPHEMDFSEGNEGRVKVWHDDYETKCFGYRVASYSKTTRGGVYVDDMQFRGQMDVSQRPLRNGAPYGNDVTFKPYNVCKNSALAISDFYTKYTKFLEKQEKPAQDDFTERLHQLSKFLGITKYLFHTPFSGLSDGFGLGNKDAYMEGDILFAQKEIAKLTDQFLQS